MGLTMNGNKYKIILALILIVSLNFYCVQLGRRAASPSRPKGHKTFMVQKWRIWRRLL